MNGLIAFAMANVALGAGLTVLDRAQTRFGKPARKALGSTGALVGVLFVGSGRGTLAWRGFELDPAESLLCGLAVAAVWMLIALGRAPRAGGLVGIAAAGLIFVVGADWLVTQLLFAVALLGGVALANHDEGASPWEVWRPLLVLTLLVAGSITAWAGADTWRTPIDADLPANLLFLVAAVVAILPLPLGGFRNEPATLAAPLLTALGFSLFSSVRDGAPYQGIGILVLAALLAGFSWWRDRPEIAASTVPSLALAAAALLAPGVTFAAGLAAILFAVSEGSGRHQGDPFRASSVGLAPIGLGFLPIAVALEGAIERLGENGSDHLGWAVAAGLLLVALAGGLWAATIVGHSEDPVPPHQVTATASWAGAGLVLLLFARPLFDLEPFGAGGGMIWLLLAAVGSGVAVVMFSASQSQPVAFSAEGQATDPEPQESHRLDAGSAETMHPPMSRPAGVVALILGGIPVLAVAWLTFQGLRVGFL